MKKVLLALIVTVMGLEASKTIEPTPTLFWEIGQEYECIWDGDTKKEQVGLLTDELLQFNGRTYFHANSDYDIYSSKIEDGTTIYLSLMKDKSIRAFSANGFNQFLKCNKKK